jgi:hypothetical protein
VGIGDGVRVSTVFFKNIFEVRSGWNMESACELHHSLVEIG